MKAILFAALGFAGATIFCQKATASAGGAVGIASGCANAGVGLPIMGLVGAAAGFLLGMES